jgi:hypothetical protein
LLLFSKYECSDQVKEDEMDRTCNRQGGDVECIWGIGGKARRKECLD